MQRQAVELISATGLGSTAPSTVSSTTDLPPFSDILLGQSTQVTLSVCGWMCVWSRERVCV